MLAGTALATGCVTPGTANNAKPKGTNMTERKGLVTFKGNPISLAGDAVKVGDAAPDFTGVKIDLSEISLSDYKGKIVILSSVPSLDTGICDLQTKRFNQEAAANPDVVVLTVSLDLPFAQKRWCGAVDANAVITVSDFRHRQFGPRYGLEIADSPLAGLIARGVMVIDKAGKIAYQQIVPEIAQEPDYDAALAAVNAL